MRPLSLAWFCFPLAACLLVVSCRDKGKSNVVTENPPLLIEPGVSVGKVRTGMTLSQVRTELGEPQRATPNALEYTALGFAVMPGPDGEVQVVMCGDVVGNSGPLVRKFTGRTKEGIGLGSTRESVVKAYGEPSKDEKFLGARESMRYDSLGITFSLEDGKVHHMIIRLNAPSPTNSAVEVSLGKPAASGH